MANVTYANPGDWDPVHDIIMAFYDQIKTGYTKAATHQEVDQLGLLNDAVDYLQKVVGGLRSAVLKTTVQKLNKCTADLNATLAKLKAIVAAVNRINEVIDIATEIAEIAAGIMK